MRTPEIFRRYAITDVQTSVNAIAKLEAKRQRDREQLETEKNANGLRTVEVGVQTLDQGSEQAAGHLQPLKLEN
jgi:hypothetical protein